MQKIDWKALGKKALELFLKYGLPALLAAGGTAGVYEASK